MIVNIKLKAVIEVFYRREMQSMMYDQYNYYNSIQHVTHTKV